jgi:PhzF family phenazine biosynthesis protein
MTTPIYYVDAFADQLFSGNPAAVIFTQMNDAHLMQNIAAENNLSETAFIRESNGKLHIRWFAPSCEIDLCGHATLASAFIYFKYINKSSSNIFEVSCAKHGQLKVHKKNNYYYLDFPTDYLIREETSSLIECAIGHKLDCMYRGRDDYLIKLKYENQLIRLKPDFSKLKEINIRGLIVTAPGDNCDFVSRCFFPSTGIDEDPVTGSAHTSLVPFWAEITGKKKFNAKQLSSRGGKLLCELEGSRVLIGGKAVEYMKGSINI